MDNRVPGFVGSTLLLLGAFVIGGGLHRVFIKGTLSITSFPFVLSLVGGGALVYAGWRLEKKFDPSELVPEDEDEGEDEFDEDLSPVSEGDLEGRERDDNYEG